VTTPTDHVSNDWPIEVVKKEEKYCNDKQYHLRDTTENTF
jgi:hypothetical protein